MKGRGREGEKKVNYVLGGGVKSGYTSHTKPALVCVPNYTCSYPSTNRGGFVREEYPDLTPSPSTPPTQSTILYGYRSHLQQLEPAAVGYQPSSESLDRDLTPLLYDSGLSSSSTRWPMLRAASALLAEVLASRGKSWYRFC